MQSQSVFISNIPDDSEQTQNNLRFILNTRAPGYIPNSLKFKFSKRSNHFIAFADFDSHENAVALTKQTLAIQTQNEVPYNFSLVKYKQPISYGAYENNVLYAKHITVDEKQAINSFHTLFYPIKIVCKPTASDSSSWYILSTYQTTEEAKQTKDYLNESKVLGPMSSVYFSYTNSKPPQKQPQQIQPPQKHSQQVLSPIQPPKKKTLQILPLTPIKPLKDTQRRNKHSFRKPRQQNEMKSLTRTNSEGFSERDIKIIRNNLMKIKTEKKLENYILRVLNENIRTKICELCQRRKPQKEFYQFHPCKHVLCLSCLILNLNESIKDKKIMKCLHKQCQSDIELNEIKRIDLELYQKYDSMLLNMYLEQSGDFVRCPQCQGYIPKNNTKSIMRCELCGYLYLIGR
ncbi:hypothetical protein KM1_162220 [Entamoeba histolytica HM-3:IMSS]|uniref:IBR domain-containing protein n=2 Tax=Entamoeba histolytica TaxID=5759 RepID=C4LUU8_ENTH1|nr:hypothetical protein EHI_178840 [Entamoeba histolytica HM-1:IMSS]EAL48019.2 hypothetical protein EHI_178840 [Entamoeba histolytica HM-1:IMSS]EMS12511.1 hypothetical protein KM1_162220 [Entamoeba histolytica HM-3:IMSS]|eukprot:XP_653406.2 hypothetical protein EHI_178840 [Entamoeba histolytica HM-1:IMSS]